MARHVLSGPNLAAGVLGVGILPDVVDGQRMRTFSRCDIIPEQAPDNIVVDRQAVLREDRVAKLLELFQNFVVHAGVVVIRTAQQHHTQAIFPFELLQHLARSAAHGHVVKVVEGTVALFPRLLVLFGRQPQDVFELFVELPLQQIGLGEVDERVQETDALFGEQVAFLDERGLHRFGRGRHRGTATAGLNVVQIGGEAIDHREENDVERLPGVHLVEQVVYVWNPQLGGEARVDGAALGAFLVQLLAGEIRIDDILRLDAQRRKVSCEDRRLRVHIEHARNTDANLGTLLYEGGAPFLRSRDLELGQRVGHNGHVRHAEYALGRHFHEVRVGLLDLVEVALDVAHFLDVLHRAFFARGDDQALRTGFQRNLGLRWPFVVDVNDVGLDVDERAQALVLAEVAAGGFFARGLVIDVRAGVEADERRLPAVVPEAPGFQPRADRAGLATVLVNNDVGLHVLALEARLDKIHLGLHRGQVVLRAALQQEALADGRQVGNLRNVKPDILGQNVAQAGHDLFRLPTLPLEIHDVALHEHCATIAERGVSVGPECRIGVLLHRHVKALRGGLQEVAVARRTLRIQLEILHAAVLQDDDLDVLAAHVANHVHVVVKVKTGLGMGHRLDQRRVGADHVLQDVLGISRGADTQNLQVCALIADLCVELLQNLDSVFNRIALGKLVRLGQDAALVVLGKEHGFGGRGSAIQSHEAFHHISRLEGDGREFLGAVFLFERRQLRFILRQAAGAALLGLLLLAAHGDVPLQLLVADILPDFIVFRFAEFHRTDGGEILRVVGSLDEVFRRYAFRQRGVALFPDLRDIALPAIAHALDVAVRAAQQQHHRQQRVAARQHRQVLHDDGLEQRRHQLVRRYAHLLQAVDIDRKSV